MRQVSAANGKQEGGQEPDEKGAVGHANRYRLNGFFDCRQQARLKLTFPFYPQPFTGRKDGRCAETSVDS